VWDRQRRETLAFRVDLEPDALYPSTKHPPIGDGVDNQWCRVLQLSTFTACRTGSPEFSRTALSALQRERLPVDHLERVPLKSRRKKSRITAQVAGMDTLMFSLK
jgi:hypothetical protein